MDENSITVNLFAWITFHLATGFLTSRMPDRWFDPAGWWCKSHEWEQGGGLYQRWFRVKAWKDHIPNGSRLYPNAFSVKRLPESDAAYLARWVRESCRSELCHWIMMLQGFLYFLWNSPAVGWAFVVWEALNNIVPIIAQRYNRPRMQRLLGRMASRPVVARFSARKADGPGACKYAPPGSE